MGLRRPDPLGLACRPAGARALRRRHVGTGAGRGAHRSRRPHLATPMTVTAIDETYWGARAASIDALERELARLRRAAVAHAKERGQALARASVLNLVCMPSVRYTRGVPRGRSRTSRCGIPRARSSCSETAA